LAGHSFYYTLAWLSLPKDTMNTKDLGTYHVKVTFQDGRGYIYTWRTARRYTKGTANVSPLDAEIIPPPFENEQQVLEAILYNFTEGNYSCDCNRLNFLEDAHQQSRTEDPACGNTIKLSSLLVITPDGREIKLL